MNREALNSLTTDVTLVTALLRLFDNDPELQRSLLKDCQKLNRKKLPKTHTRIGLYDQLTVIGNVAEKLGPNWGFDTPKFWDLALNNVFCTSVRTAPTISDSVDMLGRFGFLWSPAIYYESFQDEDFKTLTVDVIEFDELDAISSVGLSSLKELALIGAFQLLDDALDGRWTGALMQLNTNRNPSPARKLFKEKLDKTAPKFGLRLPLKLSNLPSKFANPSKYRKANLFLQNLLIGPEENRSLESLILAYINATQFHRPTIGEIAKYLGMSTRTLNRRLEMSGFSFRQILEQSLQQRTEALLKQGQLSRGEIAERLGYKDQASFSRAIRRWQTE